MLGGGCLPESAVCDSESVSDNTEKELCGSKDGPAVDSAGGPLLFRFAPWNVSKLLRSVYRKVHVDVPLSCCSRSRLALGLTLQSPVVFPYVNNFHYSLHHVVCLQRRARPSPNAATRELADIFFLYSLCGK